MNARHLLWVAILAVSFVAACNYTVGYCYPRGQGDVGGVGAGDVGVGVGATTGPSGDTPSSGTAGPACNAPDEKEDPKPPDEGGAQAGDEQALLQHDLDNDYGAGGVSCGTPSDCVNKCAIESKFCGAEHAVHPYKPPMIGDLYQCIDSFPPAKYGGSYTCLYKYPDGSACIFSRGAKLGPIHIPAPPPLCVYKTP